MVIDVILLIICACQIMKIVPTVPVVMQNRNDGLFVLFNCTENVTAFPRRSVGTIRGRINYKYKG